ncbi:hypothetical protein V8E36_008342 [Tilletia maclaganii]
MSQEPVTTSAAAAAPETTNVTDVGAGAGTQPAGTIDAAAGSKTGAGAFSRFRKRLSIIGVSALNSKNKGGAHQQDDAAAAGISAEQAPAVPRKDSSVPKRKPSTRQPSPVPPPSSQQQSIALPGEEAAIPSPAAAAGAAASETHYLLEPHMPSYAPTARSLQPPISTLRELYPPIEPFASGTLSVDDGLHSIYWELSGKQGGKPVVFLHGGPGGGTSGDDRSWFDPEVYQVLVFDQRGAGKSTPSASLEKNDTWSLVEDIERLRIHVAGAPDKWHVFGGSWGSTLSLAYAQTHPERVSALILRGIFTLRRSELLFFYQDGASHLFPELFERYRDFIPQEERHDLIGAYYRRLTGADEGVKLEAAKRWSQWEDATCRLYVAADSLTKGDADKRYLEFARIECHFFENRGFFPTDDHLLSAPQLAKIAHIPTTIVQGRYDVVCPATTAWELHRGLPHAEFVMVPDAGHSAKEPGIRDALLAAVDKYRSV